VQLIPNKNNTDIICNILEGKTEELFTPVPINVSVNAVFSKYSIAPVKTINFGPIAFFDTKSRNYEIKNEGHFEFNFKIADPSEPPPSREEDKKPGAKTEKKKEAPKKPGKADKNAPASLL
jgi:hydrocephalus-inducing protein